MRLSIGGKPLFEKSGFPLEIRRREFLTPSPKTFLEENIIMKKAL